ncbi:hypothetical protein LL962_20710, partial [Xanthomonas sp. NCPPB 1067]|uniref:hypothetical protein n=1 Tax=Xanthomonas sp. NCPPB 1067 TaxID=487524 RepID=UPI001E5708E5
KSVASSSSRCVCAIVAGSGGVVQSFPNTPAYKMAVTQTLSRIKAEAQIKGSQVNRWLTGD